ncbi:MAG: hypothetical protein GC162_00670 [Planctomycetes bacterium]|nr:hypothetical protein [Planctomycetota bacterium]
MSRLTLALTLFAGLLACLPAHADWPLTPDKSLTVYGDLRLRWEQDWDSTDPAGADRRDRDRFRIRARAGLKWQPANALLLNVRVRTGDNNSQQSPHITLWQDRGDEGDQGDFNIDRLYAKFKPTEHSSVTVGRDGLAIWIPNELLWDDDVYVDGVAWAYKRQVDEATYAFNATWAFLPDGPDSISHANRAQILAGQFVYGRTIQPGRLTVAEALLYIADDNDALNTTTDNLDFAINYTNVQFTFDLADGLPLSLGADLMVNFHDGPDGDHPNENFGYVLSAQLGGLKSRGDWLLGYYWAEIEKWAVPRFMAQDDWSRFGSATQTRSSDFRGHELRAGYMITDNINILARVYFVETITSDVEDGKRFRVDLNIKF